VAHQWIVDRNHHAPSSASSSIIDRDHFNNTAVDAISDEYNLLSPRWKTLRKTCNDYTIRLTMAIHRYSKYQFNKVLDAVTIETSKDVFTLVSEGFRTVSTWTILVRKVLAWKYTNPCSDDQLLEANIDLDSADIDYAKALKHNFSPDELTVLVDIVVMIKSTTSLLLKSEALFAPFIRFHIHHSIQQLVQGDLTPLLHRLDKRNKPILADLVKLRTVAADWVHGQVPQNDYRDYTRKVGSVKAVHPPRVCGPSLTQLYILRSQVHALIHTQGSEITTKSGIFGKADLETSDVVALDKFYTDSYLFPHLLSYPKTLRETSDLGGLWFREFYLGLTKSGQFPIELSLPWMLTEHLISSLTEFVSSAVNSNAVCKIDNVLYVLDLYNDAAQWTLHTLNQQFLYDELEAEVNLAIDQFYFIITDAVYSYHKNVAASFLLDKQFKSSIESLKGTQSLTMHLHRIELLA
jgi:cytoplasmic FMR1 interacting protein